MREELERCYRADVMMQQAFFPQMLQQVGVSKKSEHIRVENGEETPFV